MQALHVYISYSARLLNHFLSSYSASHPSDHILLPLHHAHGYYSMHIFTPTEPFKSIFSPQVYPYPFHTSCIATLIFPPCPSMKALEWPKPRGTPIAATSWVIMFDVSFNHLQSSLPSAIGKMKRSEQLGIVHYNVTSVIPLIQSHHTH